MQAPQLLVDRLQRYFHHADPNHDYLTLGDQDVACANLREALSWLEISPPTKQGNPKHFDAGLKQQVASFQKEFGHPITDGKVGPRTRDRLVRAVLDRLDAIVFRRLQRNEHEKPTAFLSYAWADGEKVDKVDQWLRTHGISVLRDREEFVAGKTLSDNIRAAVARADKIVVFYSEHSRTRDWPHFERDIAEEVEQHTGSSLIVYVRLDDTSLPQPDSNGLAINAVGVPLKAVGEQLLRAITGSQIAPPVVMLDEDAPI
jgi:hypothetical protein